MNLSRSTSSQIGFGAHSPSEVDRHHARGRCLRIASPGGLVILFELDPSSGRCPSALGKRAFSGNRTREVLSLVNAKLIGKPRMAAPQACTASPTAVVPPHLSSDSSLPRYMPPRPAPTHPSHCRVPLPAIVRGVPCTPAFSMDPVSYGRLASHRPAHPASYSPCQL